MTVDVTAWAHEVTRLTATLAARHPRLADDLADIDHLAAQIAHDHPLAAAYAQPAGLRSPSLDDGGGRSIGSHGAPTERAAVAVTPDPAGRRPADLLATCTSHRRNTLRTLREALRGLPAPEPFGDGLRAGDGTPGASPSNPMHVTNPQETTR